MEKIKFEKMGSNKILIFVYLIASSIIIFDFLGFEFWVSENLGRILKGFSFFAITFLFFRIFFFKNFVQWNKKGINIKLNNFWYQNYPFENIEQINFSENKIEIINFGGKRHTYDLQKYDDESKLHLKQILKNHINIEKTNHVSTL